jgi:hypothetical protein
MLGRWGARGNNFITDVLVNACSGTGDALVVKAIGLRKNPIKILL